MQTQVDAIQAMAAHGNHGEIRTQLTDMLRCAGKLDCAEAVPCSDQAMDLLRRLVLHDARSG